MHAIVVMSASDAYMGCETSDIDDSSYTLLLHILIPHHACNNSNTAGLQEGEYANCYCCACISKTILFCCTALVVHPCSFSVLLNACLLFMQAGDVQGMAQQGSRALDKLQKLPPRQVFEQLFTVKACLSLSAAATMASRADDNDVLRSGVREVHHLTISALNQPALSKHQLTKLCQVCGSCLHFCTVEVCSVMFWLLHVEQIRRS